MVGGVEYTIDELARAAGTTVRSVRVYHERGVLQPPQVKGRTGYYGPEHLKRVHTISRLLDRGIKLNGIKELLAAWDRGDDLGDVLGVGDPGEPGAVSVAAGDTISAAELQEYFGSAPNGLARVVAAGVYEPVDAATYRVADRELARFVDQLTAVGVSAADALTELEKLRADCDRMARRVADLIHRTAWESYRNSDRTVADIAELAESVGVLRSAPVPAVAGVLPRLIARSVEQDVELTEALGNP
ncbi:MerR family transcriptional regulator [Nocardia sp. NBC_01388]|uniref:MerR family transcriptional regulator n=1 Tax=Nocardia sp. NBC_01388 TaxID=2903596 RepID=UPI00324B8027